MITREKTHFSYSVMIVFVVLALNPALAVAYSYSGFEYAFASQGLILGALVGAIVTLIFTINVTKELGLVTITVISLLAAPIGITLFSILGASVGFQFHQSSIENLYADALQRKNQEENTLFTKIPLTLAACEANVEQVRKLVSAGLQGESSHHLGRIVNKCILSANRTDQVAQQTEIFRLLMPLLHQQYLKGETVASKEFHSRNYCNILSSVLRTDYTYLQSLKALQLPLNCDGGNTQLQYNIPSRFDLYSNGHAQETAQKIATNIEYFHSLGVPLVQVRNRSDESLLDQVAQDNHPLIMVALLRIGSDPGSPHRASSEPPAVMLWTKRKFIRCPSCTHPDLTQAEIDSVDQLMRTPTADEINRVRNNYWEPTALHGLINEVKNQPDGGAAYFRYLKAHGADLGIAASAGSVSNIGFLGKAKTIHPSLLAELKKLLPQELARMAHPTVANTTEKGEPLLQSAYANKNLALIDLLSLKR
jgi:hypothetical protein